MSAATIDKFMERKYNSFCKALTKKDQNAVHPTFVDFLKNFAEKMESDKIEMTPEITKAVTDLGWEVVSYTPQNGSNKNIPGIYLKKEDARTTSAGFLLVNRSAMNLIRQRLVENIDAIDAVLSGE